MRADIFMPHALRPATLISFAASRRHRSPCHHHAMLAAMMLSSRPFIFDVRPSLRAHLRPALFSDAYAARAAAR